MNPDQISNNKIRQVFMLAVIIILSAIILYNLSDFCLPYWEPSRYILFLEVGILNSSKKKAGNLGLLHWSLS